MIKLRSGSRGLDGLNQLSRSVLLIRKTAYRLDEVDELEQALAIHSGYAALFFPLGKRCPH